MQTSRGCSSRGGSCLRSALPFARARTAPTMLTEQTIGGYGIPAIPTQPPNYLPTEFTEHTETTGGEEKSVYICEICGRLLSARRFCGFCVFRGRFLSEAMLVQRGPLHPLKVAMLQQQGCHATTTRLPRYNNKIATLQQQGCHATTTRLPRYGKMSRNGWKMRRKTNWETNWKIGWKIGWKITPIVQESSSHYFTDTQHVVRRMEDMVDIFAYSILFIAS